MSIGERTAGVDELAHAKHMADHHRMLLNVTNKAWLRAAQAALAGDLSDIRNRVELAGLPVEFIEQTAEPAPEIERMKRVVEAAKTIRRCDACDNGPIEGSFDYCPWCGIDLGPMDALAALDGGT